MLSALCGVSPELSWALLGSPGLSWALLGSPYRGGYMVGQVLRQCSPWLRFFWRTFSFMLRVIRAFCALGGSFLGTRI
jgi:hypothetical protein